MVIASEAKQSLGVSIRLLRRLAPTRLSRSALSSRPKGSSQARNDSLSEHIFDNRDKFQNVFNKEYKNKTFRIRQKIHAEKRNYGCNL
jgi:hypothetical protein